MLPKNGVHESARTAGGQGNRLVDGGVIGDAIEVLELIEAEQEEKARMAVQLLKGPIGKALEDMLEGELALDDAINEGRQKPAVGIR